MRRRKKQQKEPIPLHKNEAFDPKTCNICLREVMGGPTHEDVHASHHQETWMKCFGNWKQYV